MWTVVSENAFGSLEDSCHLPNSLYHWWETLEKSLDLPFVWSSALGFISVWMSNPHCNGMKPMGTRLRAQGLATSTISVLCQETWYLLCGMIQKYGWEAKQLCCAIHTGEPRAPTIEGITGAGAGVTAVSAQCIIASRMIMQCTKNVLSIAENNKPNLSKSKLNLTTSSWSFGKLNGGNVDDRMQFNANCICPRTMWKRSNCGNEPIVETKQLWKRNNCAK